MSEIEEKITTEEIGDDEAPENTSEEHSEEREYGLKEEDYYDLDEITKRIAKRKEEKIARKKRARNKRITVLCIVVAVVGLFLFSISSFFTVDSIEVSGNSFFSAEEIINMAHAAPGKNLLYNPGKKKIVEYLEQNPYIENAKVSRKLPSTLVITVKERVQTAAIVYDDDFLIIDKNGVLLRKTQTEPKLTLVQGVVVKKIKLGEKLVTKDEELFDQTLDLLKLMTNGDLYFIKLDMSGMYVNAYIFESLVCKGTYKQLQDGIKEGKIHKVLEELFAQNIKRGTITLSDEGFVSYMPIVY